MSLRPYSLIASKSFLYQMWVLYKESGYKLITLQKEAGGEKREEEVESKKTGNREVKTLYKSKSSCYMFRTCRYYTDVVENSQKVNISLTPRGLQKKRRPTHQQDRNDFSLSGDRQKGQKIHVIHLLP